jgi:hypothetical protein
MKIFFHYLFVILLNVSCGQNQTSKPNHHEAENSAKIEYCQNRSLWPNVRAEVGRWVGFNGYGKIPGQIPDETIITQAKFCNKKHEDALDRKCAGLFVTRGERIYGPGRSNYTTSIVSKDYFCHSE